MDFLIITPPVCAPSEPPSGAFMLASALCAHGYDAGLLDLSLELYGSFFDGSPWPRSVKRALKYLRGAKDGYDPMQHRTEAGALHNDLKRFSEDHPGWRLTAMDIESPARVHNPAATRQLLEDADDPFATLWRDYLVPVIEKHNPGKVVISVSYLSQLTGAISLQIKLNEMGIKTITGGSFLRSLHATGEGFDVLPEVFDKIDVSNGSALISDEEIPKFLNKLSYPNIVSEREYFTARPIIPLTLSTGCYWSNCMFCPDKGMKFNQLDVNALDSFLSSIPRDVKEKQPILHLLDSAMPPARLRQFLPIAKSHNIQFYGFARPEKALTRDNLIADAADSGCLMLQLGVESGSKELLNKFNKGIDPDESKKVLKQAAEAGIRNYVYLLFGLPGETNADRMMTFDLLKGSAEHIDFLNLSIFNLPKHTELAKRADEFNIEIDDYNAHGETLHFYRPFKVDGVDPRRDTREFISGTLTADPQIKAIHQQTPKWFRAAHLAMMKLVKRN